MALYMYNGALLTSGGALAANANCCCSSGPPLGACCYGEGLCTHGMTEADCMTLSGTWYEGYTCEQNPCGY
jgi:hypothetical protein